MSLKESNGGVRRPLQIYDDVFEAFPNSSMAHYQLARELQEAGRQREAVASAQLAPMLGEVVDA